MHCHVHRTAKFDLVGGSRRPGRGHLHIRLGVLAQHGTAEHSGPVTKDTRRAAAAVDEFCGMMISENWVLPFNRVRAVDIT